MDRKDIWILLVIGVFLGLNMTFPVIPSFSLVTAYILARYYEYGSEMSWREVGGRIALSSFLLFYLSLFLPQYNFSPFIVALFIPFIIGGVVICFIIIIYRFLELKKGYIIPLAFLVSIILYFTLMLNYMIIATSILTSIIISSALYRLLVIQKKKGGRYNILKNNDKKPEKTKTIKEEKFTSFMMYIMGGMMLAGIIYLLLISPRRITYGSKLFRDLLPLIGLSVWGATLLALSSEHKLADIGYVAFGGVLIPFFAFLQFHREYPLLPLESILVIIRVLLGVSFTLILLGYDMRRIPRKGLIEYSIYGLSFLPLVLSLILVAVNNVSSFLTLIFALLVLVKVILTAGYVYKRIGVE